MKNVKFKLYVNFTTSKLAAYIILAIGTIFAFIYQDSGTLLATFSAVSAILMLKTYTVSRDSRRHRDNDYNDYNGGEYGGYGGDWNGTDRYNEREYDNKEGNRNDKTPDEIG